MKWQCISVNIFARTNYLCMLIPSPADYFHLSLFFNVDAARGSKIKCHSIRDNLKFSLFSDLFGSKKYNLWILQYGEIQKRNSSDRQALIRFEFNIINPDRNLVQQCRIIQEFVITVQDYSGIWYSSLEYSEWHHLIFERSILQILILSF